MKFIWLLTGAAIASVPFLLNLQIISLQTLGIFALGSLFGVFLLAVIFTIMLNNK